MNIENIRRILMIADTGSITQAAARLYISQPTLSQLVKATEEEIGTPIFERETRGIRLTYAGEKFVIMGRKIVRSWDALNHEILEIKEGVSNRVTVGMTVRRSMAYFPVVLPELLQKHPSVVLDQVTTSVVTQEEALLRGDLDIVISGTPSGIPDIRTITLLPEHYMIVAAKDSSFGRRCEDLCYEDRGPRRLVRISVAAEERFILPSPQSNSRRTFNQIAQEAGIVPSSTLGTTNSDVAIELVKTGLGVAIIPGVLTADGTICNRDENLSYFLLDSPFATRPVYLLHDKNKYLSTSHLEFINLIRKHFSAADQIGNQSI